jgi:hypothetical protein
MASSFASQIPTIVHLVQSLAPKRVLDIGKGFGKYGFLLHEYAGIDNKSRPEPTRTLADQSRLHLEAVEVNPSYLWPHLSHIYKAVHVGRIEELYATLPDYDVVLMIDVIEHLPKEAGRRIVDHFVQRGAAMVVATPKEFFQQELYDSDDEHHVSHWTTRDFEKPGIWLDHQRNGAGCVYLIRKEGRTARRIRGFGNAPLTKLRRVMRLLRDEL